MSNNVIKGFEKMSKQRIFNMAVAHISKTRVKSAAFIGNCLYGGTGCNAAPLLKPEARDVMDSIGNWDELVETGTVPRNNHIFIQELQTAHDFSDQHNFMFNWKNNMKKLAERWNLNTSTLNKVEI